MTTLVLRLAGPMQAWGTRSRFAYRFTDAQPSRSAVLGLLAAAQGRRRVDPIDDLLDLRFGVRVDQPGEVIRDFQTARSLDGQHAQPLTYRYYLSDAVFVAAVEGPEPLVATLSDAVQRPRFPLFLGRRSCPPARPLRVAVLPGSMDDVLASTEEDVGVPWQAATWWQVRQPAEVALDIVRDIRPGETSDELTPDVPLSFDPDHRRFAMRPVMRATCSFHNPAAARPGITDHVPMTMS